MAGEHEHKQKEVIIRTLKTADDQYVNLNKHLDSLLLHSFPQDKTKSHIQKRKRIMFLFL